MDSVLQNAAGQIGNNESRTGVAGKRKKIFAFFFGNLIIYVKIMGNLCSHRVTAQKTQNQNIGSGWRKTETFFPQKGKWIQEFCEISGFYKNSGEDQEGKQGWKHNIQPQRQSVPGTQEPFVRVKKQKKQQTDTEKC